MHFRIVVFLLSSYFILSILEQRGFPIIYDALLEQYEKLPKISFDYEVVEKQKTLLYFRMKATGKILLRGEL